ncbi:MAG: SCP2 sterol-binding domain-containing protein [Congregibacter sp.]
MNDIRLPTLHTAGLAAAEAAVNAALRLSPHSMQALIPLADEVVEIQCTRPAVSLFVSSDEKGALQLRGNYEGPVATRIQGSAEDFAALANAEDPAAALINGNIQLQGSSATLIDMQTVFNDLDIDWEAPLVDALGDVAGHQLASMLRATFAWSQQASRNLQRQLSEFALEEARLTPPKLALEHFYSQVQDLQERSERFEQRVAATRQRLQKLADR